MTATDLAVRAFGSRAPILFVHGGSQDGQRAWRKQMPLAEHFTLHLLDRRGYGDSPTRTTPHDPVAEAADIALLHGDGMHVVGHSYGGLMALLIALHRPQAVLSLTVLEPPVFNVSLNDPVVHWLVARLDAPYDTPMSPEAFAHAFGEAMQFPPPPAEELPVPPFDPARMQRATVAMQEEVRPYRVSASYASLADASFPKLVISGDWGGDGDAPTEKAGSAFDVTCVKVAAIICGELMRITGNGHAPQFNATAFNPRLSDFLLGRA